VLHNHVDVVGRNAFFTLSLLVGGGLLGSSGTTGGGGSGSGTHSSLLLGHLGGLSLGHALVGVVNLKLTEADELVRVVAADEHLRVINHEDEAVSLLDSHTSDARELLHAELGKNLAALLLASVELRAIYLNFWRVSFNIIILTLVLESGHLLTVGVEFC
jgi:hypothetical protein